MTALENITLPLDIAGRRPDQQWLDTVIDTVGLRDRLSHRPELSGGQQQRVACARALASRPDVVFADEPTGNLDSKAGAEVLGFLRRSVREFGQTVVMVTHDPAASLVRGPGRVPRRRGGGRRDARPDPERVLDRMKAFEMTGGRDLTMLRASLKSLAGHKLRLALSAVAVVLGIAFVAGSFIFTDTLGRTFDRIFEDTSAEVIVSPRNRGRRRRSRSARPRSRAGFGGRRGRSRSTASTRPRAASRSRASRSSARTARSSVRRGHPALGVDWSDTPGSRRCGSRRARARTAGEVVIDEASVDKGRLEARPVGVDPAAQWSPNRGRARRHRLGGQPHRRSRSPRSTGRPHRPCSATGLLHLDRRTRRGRLTQEEVRDRIAAALPEYDVATQEQVGEEQAEDFKTVLNFINIFLLVFAGIALFVGSFIILNTFSMLVAQRSVSSRCCAPSVRAVAKSPAR